MAHPRTRNSACGLTEMKEKKLVAATLYAVEVHRQWNPQRQAWQGLLIAVPNGKGSDKEKSAHCRAHFKVLADGLHSHGQQTRRNE